MAERGADATPLSVSTALRAIARPLAIGAMQLKSRELDAGIVQNGMPPATGGAMTTLLPASLVPSRRTALVGEKAGAAKVNVELWSSFGNGDGLGLGVGLDEAVEVEVEVEVGPAGLVVAAAAAAAVAVVAGASGGSAAAPISRAALNPNAEMTSVTRNRRRTLAPRSRNGRRGTFESEGCTVTPFSTALRSVSIMCAS